LTKAITGALVQYVGSPKRAITINFIEEETENVAFGSILIWDSDLGKRLQRQIINRSYLIKGFLKFDWIYSFNLY
jgi:hypothetical protein